MAWTLSSMLDAMRAELRQSVQPLLHSEDAVAFERNALDAAQRELALAHEWPTLRVWADVTLNPGQRVYDWPNIATGRAPDPPVPVSESQIRRAAIRWQGDWLDVRRGIDPLDFDAWDGDEAEKCPCKGERDSPPQRWDVWGERGFHVWPVPDSRCMKLRFIVQKEPRPLVRMDDQPSIDGQLVVLLAASRCATDENRRAQLSGRAASLLSTLKARTTNSEPWSVIPQYRSDAIPRRIMFPHYHR